MKHLDGIHKPAKLTPEAQTITSTYTIKLGPAFELVGGVNRGFVRRAVDFLKPFDK